MLDFAKWFCLKGRQNFTIDPQINADDAQYYFGRGDIRTRLEKQIRLAFVAPGIPKMMIHGPYGSGKTQTLFYLKHYLESSTEIQNYGAAQPLYLTIEMRSNSNAAHLHMQLTEALGKDTVGLWVRELFDKPPGLDESLRAITSDSNIILAIKELLAAGDSSFNDWRWLTWQALKSTELNWLNITRNLGEVGAGDLVNVLVAIGSLAAKVGHKLVFLLDELEELQNVKAGDASESIHQYVRRLAEPANASIGFLIGFKADVLDDAPEILRRGDVTGRIGKANYVDIPPLPAIADVKTFISDLLRSLTDKDLVKAKLKAESLTTTHGIFPFQEDAFEILADYATQDPSRALPRHIINAINECAIQAWDEKKSLVDQSIVHGVAQYIFA